MSLFDLDALAAELPVAWRSQGLARIGAANLKLLRMNAQPLAEETHAYPEGLLVIDGHLNLQLGARLVAVQAGELYVVPPGVPHAVADGSDGTLLIIDL